jgi:hypothetical protein
MAWQVNKNFPIRISLLVILFIGMHHFAYSQCTQMARTTMATPVYDRAPIFSSRSGWQLGDVIKTLAPRTSVRVCEEVTVGFFFDKRKWYRIQFDTGRSGWVFSGLLNISEAPFNDSDYSQLFVIPRAQAATTNSSGQGIPGFGIWVMLFGAFIFVIFGMIGKVTYDQLDKGQSLSLKTVLNLRKCMKALIVAPIVFGFFLRTGKFYFENEMAVLIFFAMAFQNGFFWQTVLPTAEQPPAMPNE